MNDYSNKLIYGKNNFDRITSVETNGEDLVIFRELADGSVEESTMSATHWILTNKKVSDKQTALEGNQFFKYLAEFNTLDEKNDLKKMLYQKRVEFYHINDPKEANLVYNGMTYFKGLKPSEVSLLSFDIETDSLVKSSNSEVYLITNTFRNVKGSFRYTFCLADYDSQADMLLDWCDFVKDVNPSIMIGHNILMYDLPYLNHVAKLNNVELNLGRDNSVLRFNNYSSKFRKDGSQDYEYYNAYVYGRELVDSMFLSIKYDVARNFPSYGLKPIIKFLDLEKSDRTFVDASKIKQYYNNRELDSETWANVVAYAEDDSDDPIKLFDLMVPAIFYFTQSVSKSFQQMINSATGSQINNFLVRSYLQDSFSIPKSTELTEHIEGGISFAIPRIYRNLLKIDLKSCYPSQILRFKLYDEKKDPKAYFYEMVRFFTYERFSLKDEHKKTGDKYFYDREQAAKIVINSAYGVTNTPGLNFNCPHIAKKITEESRAIIDFALKWASGEGKDFWMNKFRIATGKAAHVELEE